MTGGRAGAFPAPHSPSGSARTLVLAHRLLLNQSKRLRPRSASVSRSSRGSTAATRSDRRARSRSPSSGRRRTRRSVSARCRLRRMPEGCRAGTRPLAPAEEQHRRRGVLDEMNRIDRPQPSTVFLERLSFSVGMLAAATSVKLPTPDISTNALMRFSTPAKIHRTAHRSCARHSRSDRHPPPSASEEIDGAQQVDHRLRVLLTIVLRLAHLLAPRFCLRPRRLDHQRCRPSLGKQHCLIEKVGPIDRPGERRSGRRKARCRPARPNRP